MALSDITGGPAELKVDSNAMGHSQGGITMRVSPQQRNRTVDQYGNSPVELVHQGDEVRVTAPLAEWTAQALNEAYDPGADAGSGGSTSDSLGIGRSAGYIYGTRKLDVVPFLNADNQQKAEFYKAAPVGELEIVHNNEDDRVFNAEYVCLVDDTKNDGELIGKLFK